MRHGSAAGPWPQAQPVPHRSSSNLSREVEKLRVRTALPAARTLVPIEKPFRVSSADERVDPAAWPRAEEPAAADAGSCKQMRHRRALAAIIAKGRAPRVLFSNLAMDCNRTYLGSGRLRRLKTGIIGSEATENRTTPIYRSLQSGNRVSARRAEVTIHLDMFWLQPDE